MTGLSRYRTGKKSNTVLCIILYISLMSHHSRGVWYLLLYLTCCNIQTCSWEKEGYFNNFSGFRVNVERFILYKCPYDCTLQFVVLSSYCVSFPIHDFVTSCIDHLKNYWLTWIAQFLQLLTHFIIHYFHHVFHQKILYLLGSCQNHSGRVEFFKIIIFLLRDWTLYLATNIANWFSWSDRLVLLIFKNMSDIQALQLTFAGRGSVR